MTIEWSERLVTDIARQRAVIVIGSGVSANAMTTDGSFPPTWGEFLFKAYGEIKKKPKEIKYIKNALDRYNYLGACSYIKTELGTTWNTLLQNSFSKPRYNHAPIHEHIYNLDCRIIISLNFDKIYEDYAVKLSENTFVVKNYHDPDIRQTVAGNERYVIKPHGSIESQSKLIFTLEDYAEARTKHAGFYDILAALLHTHTFLFIGCGLSDPDLQIIFENYKYQQGESPHFMTCPIGLHSNEKDLIQKTRGINILEYSPKDKHKALTESVKKLAEQVSDVKQTLADTLSW